MNQTPKEAPLLIKNSKALREIAHPLPPPFQNCTCPVKRCKGWSSLSESAWPSKKMTCVANLHDPTLTEPTFEEFHPQGTRYDSEDAPFAVEYFPLNRSQLFSCQQCGRWVLKYTEFGGYYMDSRARILDPKLIAEFKDDSPA